MNGALTAATPVGATTTAFFNAGIIRLRNVVFPLPPLPVINSGFGDLQIDLIAFPCATLPSDITERRTHSMIFLS